MIPPMLSATVDPGTNTGGVPGKPDSAAYGNPGVSTEWQPGYPAKNPGSAYSGNPADNRTVALGVGQESAWRGGAAPAAPGVNKLITRDREIIAKRGHPRTGIEDSVAGNPPNPDGPISGPARPVFASINRTINYQEGSDNTANQDVQRPYNTSGPLPDRAGAKWGPMARRPETVQEGTQFVGEQGNGWGPIYGGTPGLYQPYGSYAGYTARDTKGIQSPVADGAPGDGPHKVFGGPPHGLHSQTYPSYDNTLGRYLAVPQMRAPRVDRPANSPIAGQDYSQTVQPQGETGTVVQNANRFMSQSRFGSNNAG